MKVYVQGEEKLEPISADLTADGIKDVLGYTPADEADLPDITNEDDTTLYVTDKDGNIITKVDADGLHTTGITLNGESIDDKLVTDEEREAWNNKSDFKGYESIDESDDSTLYVTDKDGNIVTRTDSEGFHAASMTVNGKDVESGLVTDEEREAWNAPTIDTTKYDEHIADTDIHVTADDKANWAAQEERITAGEEQDEATKVHITDGTIHTTAEEKALWSDKSFDSLTDSPISSSDDTALYVVDSQSNVVARIDCDGLHAVDVYVGNTDDGIEQVAKKSDIPENVAKTDSSNIFSGNQSVTGNLTVGGNLVVNGTNTTVNSTTLAVKDKLIEVASGNTTALTTPAGLVIPKYDGTNDCAMVFDSTGTAYVGKVSLDSSGNITVDSSALKQVATKSDIPSAYTLPTASTSALGGIKIQKVNNPPITTVTSVPYGRYYPVEVNSNGLAYVGVPWENTTYEVATASKDGLMSTTDKDIINNLSTNYVTTNTEQRHIEGDKTFIDDVSVMSAFVVYPNDEDVFRAGYENDKYYVDIGSDNIQTEVRVGGETGTSGQVLTSQGAGITPTWAAPSIPNLTISQSSTGTNSIGYNISNVGNVCIGNNISGSSSGSNVVLGQNVQVNGAQQVVIGDYSNGGGTGSITIGYGASTDSYEYAIAIGDNAQANAKAVAIGDNANANNYYNCIAIGSNVSGPSGYGYNHIGANYTSSGRALLLGVQGSGYTYMNAAGSSWTSASDIRDKTDIEEIDHALDFIGKLKPITYVMNEREKYLIKDDKDMPILDENGKRQYDKEAHAKGEKKKHRRFAGLSAQDTYQAMLDCYDGNANYAQIVDNNKYDNPDDEYIEQYSMSYERLVPFLIKAIQEQQAQIDELKEQIKGQDN